MICFSYFSVYAGIPSQCKLDLSMKALAQFSDPRVAFASKFLVTLYRSEPFREFSKICSVLQHTPSYLPMSERN